MIILLREEGGQLILSLVRFREASSDSLQLMRIEGSTSELTSLGDNGVRRG